MNESTPSQGGQDAAARARTMGEKLREDGLERIDSGRRSAAQHVEGIADAVDAARSHLEATQPTLAHYTARLANGIERVAVRLRDSSVDDLTRDARQFAARNPAVFVLGSMAAGVLLARFLKASSGSPMRSSAVPRADDEPLARAVPASEGEPAVGGTYGP